MFAKRRDQYLCLNDTFKYVYGSSRATDFGSDPVSRRSIITASRAADLLGIGYHTREFLMTSLANPGLAQPEIEDSYVKNAQQHGHKFEKEACEIFFDRMRYKWRPIGSISKQITYISKYVNKTDLAGTTITVGATPDQLIFDPEEKKLALLEIKCPYRKFLQQEQIGEFPSACSLLADKHYVQCQIQMLLLNLDEVYLFFYVPQRDGTQSFNTCLWLVRGDSAYQQFLLSNLYQAYADLIFGQSRFKLLSGEGKHNKEVTGQSKKDHCTYLIP